MHNVRRYTRAVVAAVALCLSGAACADEGVAAGGDDGGATTGASGGADPSGVMSAAYRKSTRRCPRPADPRRIYMDCRLDWFDALLETVTEFWAVARDDMQLAGVTPRASLYGNFFANAGGPDVRPIWGGTLSLSLSLDMERLLGGPSGTSFYVAGLGGWSRQGWPYPVSVNYVKTGAWLTELYVQQKLVDGRLTLALGRLQPAMTFAFLPVMLSFLSPVVFAGWLSFDEPPYPPAMASQWGAQGVFSLAPDWQVALGVYGNNPYSAKGASHGFDWQLWQGNMGLFTMAQATWLPGARPGRDELPGMYALGGWYDGDEFVDLGTGAPSRGNYGLYLMGQQMVLRHGEPGSPRGLTAFAMLTWAPRVDVNVVPLGVEGGASWHGFSSSRPLDTVALALWWGRSSPALQDLRGTAGFEANYDLAFTRALSLVADLQGLLGVNGVPGSNAIVAGVQLALTL
jgi:porin